MQTTITFNLEVLNDLGSKLDPQLAWIRDDLQRITQALLNKERPRLEDLRDRRLKVMALRDRVKARVGGLARETDNGCPGAQAILTIADALMLENFTKFARDEGKISVVHGDAEVKTAHYRNPDGQDIEAFEYRDYIGMHTRLFDTDGLSVVTAVKPPLYEQPWHVHGSTTERTLALHTTTAVSFRSRRRVEQILESGEMVFFRPKTAHTIANPTLEPSVDSSVKLPGSMGDRRSFKRDTSSLIAQVSNGDQGPGGIMPTTMRFQGEYGSGQFYYIKDENYSYHQLTATLHPNSAITLDGLNVDEGGVGVMRSFTQGGVWARRESDIVRLNDSGMKEGDIAFIPPNPGTVEVRNLSTRNRVVYIAWPSAGQYQASEISFKP